MLLNSFWRTATKLRALTSLRQRKRPAGSFTRDALWHGGDMIGLGVSSFSHFGGVNFQNAHNFEEYVRILNEDRLPLLRAVSLTPKQTTNSRDDFAAKDRLA